MTKIYRHCTIASLLLFMTAASLIYSNGCFFRPSIPIPVIEYGRMDASEHKNLLILLRGLGGSPEDFEKYGLIQEVRSRGLPFDIVVPDSHFGYYRSRTLEQRLKYDLIEPARRAGYQRIWLAGFSMGGLGSLFYLRSYKDDVDGVMLISPFMGWETILDRIEASGGLENWTPKENTDNWQQLIWAWVKQYCRKPEGYPPIFLGYGTDDTLSGKGPVLLSTALPKERIFTVSGGHTYKIFKLIWKTHLDRLEQRFKTLPR